MRLAWFTPGESSSDDGFNATVLVDELRAQHVIEVYDERRAHDFVWTHAREPFDLCIYDLAAAPSHEYVWAYPCHYPGLVRLPGDVLRTSRAIFRIRDDRRRQRVLDPPQLDGDALEPFIASARLTVVPDEYLARALELRYPGSRVRHALVGRRPVEPRAGNELGFPLVGVVAGPRAEAILRAIGRAEQFGAALRFATFDSADDAAAQAEVVLSASWPPPPGIPLDVLAGLSAGRAVVLLETEATAILPTLNPQTWRPRSHDASTVPVAISVDPRDEEHSLMLALVRLSADAVLRQTLGRAGHAWWEAHASVASTARAWHDLLDEACSVDPSSRRHGREAGALDGSGRARLLLAECGASVDFLDADATA